MLGGILKNREKAIAERWVEIVMNSYPAESSGFLLREKDPFSNPVGHLVREASVPLVRALQEETIDAEALGHLDGLMRLRSVQDWTAAQAVGVIPLLRRAVLDVAGKLIDRESLLELIDQVDRLSLAAFDVFTACRRQLAEVRLHERDRHQASLLRRAEEVLAGARGRSIQVEGGSDA